MPPNFQKLQFDLHDLEHEESPLLSLPSPSLPSLSLPPSLPSPSPPPPPTEPVATTFYHPSAEKVSSRAPSPVKLPRAATKALLPSDFDSDGNGTEPFPGRLLILLLSLSMMLTFTSRTVFVPLTTPSLPAKLSRSTSPFKSSAASPDVHTQTNRALASTATALVTAPEVVLGNLHDSKHASLV